MIVALMPVSGYNYKDTGGNYGTEIPQSTD
jgi:hypothetical protein